MNSIRTLLAALLVAGAAGAAQAQEPFQVTGRGENFAVEYAPDYTGNIVGGGEVLTTTTGKDPRVVYADPNVSQTAGIPSFTGGSQGDVVYTAPAAAPAMMAGGSNQG
jgi:hypothetical protein